MTENLNSQGLQKTLLTEIPGSRPVVRRGRPKGSKNKPKLSHTADAVKPAELQQVRRRGRPKGSKNKPKEAQVAPPVNPVQEVQTEDHPLLKAVKWLEKYMHPIELQYYRTRANKAGVPLHVAMASDVLGFFNVQDPEICKQIKKNNFIINNNTHVIHQ